jgi:hypothetical protein
METVHELFLDLFRNTFSTTEMITVNAGLTKMLEEAGTSY